MIRISHEYLKIFDIDFFINDSVTNSSKKLIKKKLQQLI